ncbi:MAG: nuclear transport factor 2 family protein [Acidimicrobiia bacterium]|nr:nuclear transport factor 2 family protein [Acidimicrobiia bacterium]
MSALLTWASKAQSFDGWSAETLATSVGVDVASSVELEKYIKHDNGGAEEMTLRATQVYRQEDGQWRIVHRHGDILTPVEVKW